MQKIIISVLLLVMASVPVTAHAINVVINGITYSGTANSLAVLHNDGQIICASASNFPVTGAVFEFRESGDIKDMVISDLLCFNQSGTNSATLSIDFSNAFFVANIARRYYFLSVQGSFFGSGQGASLSASSVVTFFNNGGATRQVPIGSTGGSFTDAFGPQNPVQVVNLIDCAWNNCTNVEVVSAFLRNITLAPGQGIYLYGSHHTGSSSVKEEAAAYMAALTAKIVVENNNSVGIDANGHAVLTLFGAVFKNKVVGDVVFNVRNVDIASLRFGPVGGPGAPTDGPVTYRFAKGDKIEDVRVRFPNEIDGQQLWSCDTTKAALTGEINIGGTVFPFTATANVVPSPCP